MNEPPTEDSEDLTDEQIAQAVATERAGDFSMKLPRDHSCQTCRLDVKYAHALRRRVPHLYSRTIATCPNGHTRAFVFIVDWLK